MRAKTDASRAHLYETCRFVDMYKTLEDIQRERKLTPEERKELKYYTRLADAFTPIGRGLAPSSPIRMYMIAYRSMAVVGI